MSRCGPCATRNRLKGATRFSFTLPAIHPLHGKMPICASTWDSLGDGYEAANDIQDARAAYARSVELNPNNEHAKGELVKLRK